MRYAFLALLPITWLCGCSLTDPGDGAGAPRTVIAARAEARDGLHVSPTGDDDAAGTIEFPWRTLATALGRLRAGDTLWVHSGTYRERVDVTAAKGRPLARVRVAAYPGDRPLLRGSLWIGEGSYWTIEGLHVTWDERFAPHEPMVRMYGGTGWVLRRNELSDARSIAALLIDDGPNQDLGEFVVRENCIHDTIPSNGENQDHNIYVDDFGSSAAPRGLIERNIIFNAPNGNNIKLGGGNGGGPRQVDVRFNSMYGANRNVSLSIAASDNRVHRNVLVSAREANILGFDLTGTNNSAFENLTFDAPLATGVTSGSAPITSSRNVSFDPQLDAISCSGFRSRDPQLPYGRYG